VEEWLMTPVLVHMFEYHVSKYYSFQPQDVVSKHNLNNQKNAPAIYERHGKRGI